MVGSGILCHHRVSSQSISRQMTKKPTTSEELQRAIAKIISKRAIEASQIPYDTKVWVGAVAEARRVFERVALVETIEAYHKDVVRALSIASDTYNDSDGEYTNGRGGIGNVLYDVMGLLPAT